MMERAVRLDPGNTWYNTQLASLYLSNEQTEDAIKIYESLRKSHTQQVELYDGLIDIYVKTEKTQSGTGST